MRVIEAQADWPGVPFEDVKRRVFPDDALGVLTETGDIAGMAVFLASHCGRHVTAQDSNVDAGTAWY